MLGWWSLAAARISRRKRSSTPGRLDEVAADDLEDLQSRPMSLFWAR